MGTRSYPLIPLKTGVLVLVVFLLCDVGAGTGGGWRSALSDDEYCYHISRLERAEYGHPGRR